MLFLRDIFACYKWHMKGITLFASGGIGDLALKSVGVEAIVANELLCERAEVFKYNYSNCQVFAGDIYVKKEEIINTTRDLLNGEQLDFLLATPPCQGMSKNGRGKLLNRIRKGERPVLDSRNRLIIPTIEIIEKLLPKIVVIENVPEMRDTLIEYDSELIGIIDFVKKELQPLGYVGCEEVIEFADYGVPQRRQRLIAVFSRDDNMKNYYEIHSSFIPQPTHSAVPTKDITPWITVRDAIKDVPSLDAGSLKEANSHIPFHNVPILDEEKYFWVSNTPVESGAFDNQCVKCGFSGNPIHGASKDKDGINKANKDTPIHCLKCGALLPRPWVKKDGEYRLMKGYSSAYRRMKWDLPATALTTNLSYACSDSKLHPEQNRTLSLYEAFIIHTVDKYDYKWNRRDGKKVSDKLIREIIGESIPPRGFGAILKHVVEIYKGVNTTLKPKSRGQA